MSSRRSDPDLGRFVNTLKGSRISWQVKMLHRKSQDVFVGKMSSGDGEKSEE